MAKADKDFQEKLRIEIGPYNHEYWGLHLSVSIVVADKKVKDSVNNKYYIENDENFFVCLVQIDFLCHIYWINDDVNDKHDLY